MFKINRKTRSHAQELRANATDAEKKLWRHLKMKQLGCKFRRQHPVPPYIVDFACLENRLIIELDGGQHCENVRDEKRTAFLREKGFHVLRFWNNEVSENIEGVLHIIGDEIKLRKPPS